MSHWIPRPGSERYPVEAWPEHESHINRNTWYLGGLTKDGKSGTAFMYQSMNSDGRYRVLTAFVDKDGDGWKPTFYVAGASMKRSEKCMRLHVWQERLNRITQRQEPAL